MKLKVNRLIQNRIIFFCFLKKFKIPGSVPRFVPGFIPRSVPRGIIFYWRNSPSVVVRAWKCDIWQVIQWLIFGELEFPLTWRRPIIGFTIILGDVPNPSVVILLIWLVISIGSFFFRSFLIRLVLFLIWHSLCFIMILIIRNRWVCHHFIYLTYILPQIMGFIRNMGLMRNRSLMRNVRVMRNDSLIRVVCFIINVYFIRNMILLMSMRVIWNVILLMSMRVI